MDSFVEKLLAPIVEEYGLTKVEAVIANLGKNNNPLKVKQPKKRISKITAKTLEILEKAFEKSNTVVVDKIIKDGFMDYVNNLDEETFASHDLVHHAEQYTETHTANTTTTTTTVVKPKKFTKRNKVESVTYEKLKEMSEHLSKVENAPAGTFLNTVTNKFVTGPEEPENEEVTEVTFNDKEYHVGDISYRVYKLSENDEEGEFCGYYGIDEFKEMVKN